MYNDQMETPSGLSLGRLSLSSLSNKSEQKEEKTESLIAVTPKTPIAETGQIMKSASSYYLYKSTSKEEAEQYRPQKIDVDAVDDHKTNNKGNKGSSWNNGATMEQFDYSELMKERIKELLLQNVQFGHFNHDEDVIAIDEVKEVWILSACVFIHFYIFPILKTCIC